MTLLLYADDIVLLSDSECELQQLLTVVGEYARKWRFEVNHAKCGLMCFTAGPTPNSSLTIGTVAVPWVSVYKYLGVELHASRVTFSLFRRRMESTARRAAGAVASMGLYSGKLTVPLAVQVYRALVRPLLEYAAEITSLRPWSAAESVQLSMARRILQCSTTTPTAAVMGDLNLWTMESRWQLLRLCFWAKIKRRKSIEPVRAVYDESVITYSSSRAGDEQIPLAAAADGWSVYRPAERGEKGLTLWPAQIKCDLYTLGLERYWRNDSELNNISIVSWKSIVKKAVLSREQSAWWRSVSVSSMLQLYSCIQQQDRIGLALYLTVPHGGWHDRILIGRRALTRLRSGNSELRIHTGRFEQLERRMRLCEQCGVEVEDTRHFLLRCNYYEEQRRQLFTQLELFVQHQCQLSSA